MKKGYNTNVYIEISDITNAVTENDKQLVLSKISSDDTVAMYFDICMYKEIGIDKTIIEQTNSKVKISLEIPSELLDTEDDIIFNTTMFIFAVTGMAYVVVYDRKKFISEH